MSVDAYEPSSERVAGPARVTTLRAEPDAAHEIEPVARRGGRPRRRNGWVRYALTLGGVALVAAIFVAAGQSGRQPPQEVDLALLAAGVRVDDARFLSLTARGEPLEIRADEARPDGPNPEHVELDVVTGSVRLEGGRVVTLEAARGDWRRADDEIVLTGDVEISSDDGYTLTTPALRFDTREMIVRSDAPVVGVGPAGRLTADRMILTNDDERGGVARFEGAVRLTITEFDAPTPPAGPAAPTDAEPAVGALEETVGD